VRASDLLALAWAALRRQRLRSSLTLLGVAIGVSAVVLLTALGEGARRYVQGQFEALGTNLLIVVPGKTETSGALPGIGGAPNDLTLADARALERGVPAAEIVVPIALGNDTVAHRERRRQVVVIGSTTDFLTVRKLAIQRGSFLPPLDWNRSAKVVVLGSALASELFPGENPLGAIVRIGDARTRVIGVLAPRGMQLGVDMDDLAIVPVASAMRLFNRSSLFRIVLQVGHHARIEAAEEHVRAIVTERHGEEDVTCITQDSVSGSLTGILAVLTLAIAGVAAISLSVAGIGVMNVMLVAVSERREEIGLLRAIGARSGQILALFLVEAVLLSIAGGAIGVGASWLVTELFELWFPGLPIDPPVWAVLAAVGLAVATGVLFGVLPARRASHLDPVEALTGR